MASPAADDYLKTVDMVHTRYGGSEAFQVRVRVDEPREVADVPHVLFDQTAVLLEALLLGQHPHLERLEAPRQLRTPVVGRIGLRPHAPWRRG